MSPPDGSAGRRFRQPGARVGPFTVLGELGQGGMGLVLQARHDDGRVVALKLMAGTASLKRFEREIAALAALDHPHVVSFVGASQDPPVYLAMEFVEGQDLERLLGREHLSPERVARLMAQVAEGVAHAHGQGVVHRDLKPGNVLVRDADGAALVTDFGLARAEGSSRFTQTGTAVGSILHMAPEQVRGEDVGPAADVWALGTILYRCLTGRDVFPGREVVELAAQIIESRIEAPQSVAPDAPADLAATAMACLARDPAERPSAASLARALRTRRPPAGASRGRPAGTSRARWTAGACVLVGALAAAFVVSQGAGPAAVSPAPAAASPATAPWPKLGGAWRPAWRLGQDATPEGWPARAWSEEARLVDPQAAWSELFLGTVRDLGQGLLQVDYDLSAALWLEHTSPVALLRRGQSGQAELMTDADGSVRWLAPNDTGMTLVHVGSAWWERAAATLRFRRVEPVDTDSLALHLGLREVHDVPFVAVAGRRQVLDWPGGHQPPFQPGEGWSELAFAPGAEPGERLRLDGQPLLADEGPITRPSGPGPVVFASTEAHYAIGSLELRGRPLRGDRAARARIPVVLDGEACVAAAFVAADARPWVGLGPAGSGLRLVREADQVGLFRGKVRVAAWPCPPAEAGWLRLSWADDLAHVEAQAGGSRIAGTVAFPAPLPAATWEASYGSEAGVVRFERVEVASGRPDPSRRRYDAAAIESPEPALEVARGLTSTARAGWWEGATLLEGLTDPARLDLTLLRLSPPLRERELTGRAQRARALLLEAADQLAPPARADALARAALACVLAGDVERAGVLGSTLREELGPEAAVVLGRVGPRAHVEQALLDQLVRGYATAEAMPIREAGLALADAVAPERRPEIAFLRAGNLALNARHGGAGARQSLERAVALYDEARAGPTSRSHIDREQADAYMALGRYAEALANWEVAATSRGANWWVFTRRAQCLQELGRPAQALESAIGALACAPRRTALAQDVLDRVQGRAGPPGLLAAALQAVGDCLEEASQRRALVDRARDLALRAGPEDELDLAGYVLARAGLPLPLEVTRAARPRAVLAQAAAGDPSALERLAEQARLDRLVEHLARLNPELAPRLIR